MKVMGKALLLAAAAVVCRTSPAAEAAAAGKTERRENIEWSMGYAFGVTGQTRSLPRVLLIGDSITAQRQDGVRRELNGRMTVTYWASSYCVTSPRYKPLLEFYLNDAEYAAVYFNNGLHALKTPPDEWEKSYREALELILRRQPKAKVILVTSTPLTPYRENQNRKVRELNSLVMKIAAEKGLPVDDLYAPMARQFPSAWSDGVHFKAGAIRLQAKHAASAIFSALGEGGSAVLAVGGVAKAQIVVDVKANRAARFAALDLKWHLDRITGGDFKITDKPEAGLLPIYVGESAGTTFKGADLQRQQFLVDVRRNSITLMGRDKDDKGKVTYFNDARGVGGAGWPVLFDDQGTMYAVYEFLENVVGVKWLDSTDFGTVLPKQPDLAVPVHCRSGAPFIRYRVHSGVVNRYEPLTWSKTEKGHAEYEKVAYANPGSRNQQGELFQIRHRMGGECLPANHSLYYFYNLFWNRGAREFVEYHPEYFAKGYAAGTPPPQLCYSNTGTIARVIADIREYFDNPKGFKRWGPDNYCLEPMDNSSFCKCADCVREYEPEREADLSSQSTHWFRFVNKVAGAIRATHPGKRLCTLAYGQHEGLPKGVKLESNVTVYFCLSANRTPYQALLEKQMSRMRQWREAYPSQPLAMWLYNCFPAENAHLGNFHCFPGFFSKEEERQYKLFQELVVRDGLFHCGFDGEVDNYIQLEKMIDPTRSTESLKDEYFSMYGAAGKYLREFYDTVENRYCDASLYPKNPGHQSAPVAWGLLGTEEVMKRLEGLMAKAEAAARDGVERKRVELWKLGVWNYMKQGRESYVTRMNAPMPEWTARRVASAGGDPDRVEWAKAGDYPVKFFGAGSDELSGYAGNLKFAHDGKWFYFELKMTVPDTRTLVNLPGICSHDCWEILMARQKSRPYRCWFSAPDGRMHASSWGEVNFRSEVSAAESGAPNFGAVSKSDTSNGRDWTARYAFPLEKFLDAPVAPGDRFYLNAVNCMGSEHPEVVEWCKTHSGRFIMSTLTSYTTVHTTDRIGTVTLEK